MWLLKVHLNAVPEVERHFRKGNCIGWEHLQLEAEEEGGENTLKSIALVPVIS